MSWGNYTPGQSGSGGQHGDPWGRTYGSGEPSGYVTNDPYATPAYNQPQDAYGSPYPAYQPPYQHYGPVVYSYDAAHPPRPNVGFVQALQLFFKNYAVFHGRASRAEYWWMALWGALFGLVTFLPMMLVIVLEPTRSDPPGIAIVMLMLWVVVGLGTLVPTISLQVRRLHDAGFSGFFTLISYAVPYVGWLAPTIMSFFPSTPNGVKFDNPNGTQPATT
ncbi:DUF805 domain-containing protein [Granulicoccus sp. GXG6511]|uniref:DUF805 domain-containing protein n=1 Tax=Granulicoccus sp. GXG6511 TaxID=3381351 RepID=UPI003D7E899C